MLAAALTQPGYDARVRIVTLTSDFGTADGYVGAMKGVILSRARDAHIVDIAHDVPRYNIAAGAYCLRQATPYFPAGTIHVAVVDPGVGTRRKAVIADDGRCLYVAPDNGILGLAVPAPRAVYAIEAPAFRREVVSSTFHGRDIFAAAAGYLAAGGRAHEAGPEVVLSPLAGSAGSELVCEPDGVVRAPVVHVDGFGNLITSCPASAVPEGARILAGDFVVAGLGATFADVAPGQVVAYIGSAGTVEIAVREDSAAKVLGMGPGQEIVIEPGSRTLRSKE